MKTAFVGLAPPRFGNRAAGQTIGQFQKRRLAVGR
jgi:hypothetical protein